MRREIVDEHFGGISFRVSGIRRFFFSFFFRQVDVTGDLYEREYLKDTKRKCMENCDTTCSESKKYWHA